VSFAAALRTNTQQQQMPHPQLDQEACRARVTKLGSPVTEQQHYKQSGQSAQAPNVNNGSLDNMFRVAPVVQQIMSGLNDAVSEEKKIVALTKTVLKIMNSNGC
jgi:hypothetical protein